MFKDFPHQLINDTVKNMGRISGLTIAVGLLAGFSIADIPYTLHNSVGIFLAGICLAVGREVEPGAAMPAENIAGQKRVAHDVTGNRPLGFSGVRAVRANMLGSFVHFRRYDLQMTQHFRAAFAASQDTGISQVTDDPPDGGVVPVLAAPRPVAQLIQVGCDPLGSKPLMYIFIKDDMYHGSLGLVDSQLEKLMLLFIEPTALYEVIAIWGNTALETSVLDDLAEGGFCTDRCLFAFTVCLPETQVVGEFVRVVIKALFALLGAPDPDAVLDEPLHYKGRFVCDPSNAVKHEHQQNIKFSLFGVFSDEL